MTFEVKYNFLKIDCTKTLIIHRKFGKMGFIKQKRFSKKKLILKQTT